MTLSKRTAFGRLAAESPSDPPERPQNAADAPQPSEDHETTQTPLGADSRRPSARHASR